MESELLREEIQQFIDKNIGVDVSKLALQKNPFADVNWIDIVNQISAKSKAKDKLPTWFKAENIIYPSKVSVEQTSSEKAANYKSELISGNSIIDLTGGFGVDDYFFSKRFNSVVHCEINEELSNIVMHNFSQLDVKNVDCISGDSTVILKNLNRKFDWIYIDPSRRNDAKGKVFMLNDCLPNVPELLNFYFKYSENILIKTAPILDISAGLSELNYAAKIHIVAVENEVKELLWEISDRHSKPVKFSAVNITKDGNSTFEFPEEDNKNASYGLPKKHLYEPNSAIMKSGGFNAVAIQFGLEKLHPHSHLYTSDKLVSFPGRIFEVKQEFAYQKTEMKNYLEGKKANITIRNFPDSVETIRKKWKIKDGGENYCFFTTDVNNNKIVLICNKI